VFLITNPQVTWDGRALCWGNNSCGQCGLPASQAVHVADPTGVQLPLGQLALSISAGLEHVACVSVSGEVLCWGSNRRGQLGTPHAAISCWQGVGWRHFCLGADSQSPVAIVRHQHCAGFSQVACGGNHTVAVSGHGDVFAWGFNAHGQCGPGKDAEQDLRTGGGDCRVDATEAMSVVKVCAGANFTLAITPQGRPTSRVLCAR
jgi:alpha-tubulin suppressor-like RCC1 family protein